MNFAKLSVIIIAFFAAFVSCTKEEGVDFTSQASIGTLKKTAAGDCGPITINGVFKVGSTLNENSYVDIQVTVTSQGTYDISTDTINGYSFSKSGALGTGLHTIRLSAKGQPIAAGTNTFTVRYGNSTCTFNIVVTGGTTTPAVYTLGGSPGSCTGFVLNGSYTSGVPLAPGNSVALTVNVTAIGSYNISTDLVNGIIFSATGQFLTTGTQTITLSGSGTPVLGGSFPFTVTGNSGSCSFSVTVVGPAVYTLGGAGSNCTGFVLAGTYLAAVPLTAANTATIDVNVTVTGAFNISSTTVDGIKFSKTGNFTSTGPQTVVLVGSGTPTVANTFVFPVSGGTTTCNFSLTVNPTPVSAYTFNCATSTVNGSYNVGTALGTSNTITLSVNVTSVGTYTISSLPAVNGISFSKTGLFTSTGTQTVVLPGSGTPAAAGPFNYTVTGGSNTCSFSITAVTGPPSIFSCKIDGVLTSFVEDAHATVDYNIFGTTETMLTISGRLLPVGSPTDNYSITISKPAGGSIPTGTYNENTFVTSGGVYKVGMSYFINSTSVYWTAADNTVFSPNPPFTITITTLTATRCIGTFSGKIRENFGTGPGSKMITEGVFDIPVQ